MIGKIGSLMTYSFSRSFTEGSHSTYLLLGVIEEDTGWGMLTNIGRYLITRRFSEITSSLYFYDKNNGRMLEGPTEIGFNMSLADRFDNGKLVENW